MKCRLWETRTNSLPGEGDLSSELMIVAQAPGRKEDQEGRMFVGPSGKKLDELLPKAEINRGEVFMTNLLRCMLPEYRKPREDEIEACSPYLDREIELVNPKIISTLGYFSTKYIFEKYDIEDELEFPKVCGKIFTTKNKKILPLGHPAALLYDNSLKEGMTEHYEKLGKLLNSI